MTEKMIPIGAIYPHGGEPLYEEPGTGLRLTAADFAHKHGYSAPGEVEAAMHRSQPEKKSKKNKDEVIQIG